MPPTLIAVTREVLRLIMHHRIALGFGEVFIIKMPKTLNRVYDSVVDFDLVEPNLPVDEYYAEYDLVAKRHGDICWFKLK